MFSVHAQIKFKKSIWGVVKGLIEKNTWNGLEDFYTALLHSLQSETCIPPAKGKGRRPRRGKHKQTANANVLSMTPTIATTTATTIAPCTAISSTTATEYDSHYHHLVMQDCSSSHSSKLNYYHQLHNNHHQYSQSLNHQKQIFQNCKGIQLTSGIFSM